MSYRELAFWQGEDGYAILDVMDNEDENLAIHTMVINTAYTDETVGPELSEIPDLPGYRRYRMTHEGLAYIVQVHWGMGHVALYSHD